MVIRLPITPFSCLGYMVSSSDPSAAAVDHLFSLLFGSVTNPCHFSCCTIPQLLFWNFSTIYPSYFIELLHHLFLLCNSILHKQSFICLLPPCNCHMASLRPSNRFFRCNDLAFSNSDCKCVVISLDRSKFHFQTGYDIVSYADFSPYNKSNIILLPLLRLRIVEYSFLIFSLRPD